MPLEKALITNVDTGEKIPVLFNPSEYTISKDVTFAQIPVPGLPAPLLQFVHGNLKTLEMELLVDTYESHGPSKLARLASVLGSATPSLSTTAGQDVRTVTRRITQLMEINSKTHAPPLLLFTWGSLTLRCVLAKVTERYIMFLPSGVPVRARLQVTFNEFVNAELQAKEIKTETADYSKLYVVGQDETLSKVAATVYENPLMWRPIAIHNGIDDPRQLAVGQRLLIPRLPYLDPETGEVMQ